MQNLYWLAENPASCPYHSVPLSHAGATAAAATGTKGPSPRFPPPKRQNTKGVMASSLDKYRRGGWSMLAAQTAIKLLRRKRWAEKVEVCP